MAIGQKAAFADDDIEEEEQSNQIIVGTYE